MPIVMGNKLRDSAAVDEKSFDDRRILRLKREIQVWIYLPIALCPFIYLSQVTWVHLCLVTR